MTREKDYWITKDSLGIGDGLVLKTAWNDAYLDVISKHNIVVLVLNDRMGWNDLDIKFVTKIPSLTGVSIISDRLSDISPLFELKHLKALSLTCPANATGDFSNLRCLGKIFLTWRNAYKSIFSTDWLNSLNIDKYPGEDLTAWRENEHLRVLKFSSRKMRTLRGIAKFPSLEKLELFDCRVLDSISALSSASRLQQIRFEQCKQIGALDEISELTELRILEIEDCGNIQSLRPLLACKKLEFLQIAGKTWLQDKDLHCLRELPHLKKLLLSKSVTG